jgi:uncharacterized Tic20 family protein
MFSPVSTPEPRDWRSWANFLFAPYSYTFTADLPPEICIARWRSATQSRAVAYLGLATIEVDIAPVPQDEDTWEFHVAQRHGRRVWVKADGTLRRAGSASTVISGEASWNYWPMQRTFKVVQFVPILMVFFVFGVASGDIGLGLGGSAWLSFGVVMNRAYCRYLERKLAEFLRRALDAQPDPSYAPVDSQFPTVEQRKAAVFVNHFLIWVALGGLGLIFSTVVYLRNRGKSPFVSFHARQAIVWQLIIVFLFVIALILGNSVRGSFNAELAGYILFFDWILWGPITMILSLLGGRKISRGQTFRYPIIGRLIS